jgi:hypothetical protein
MSEGTRTGALAKGSPAKSGQVANMACPLWALDQLSENRDRLRVFQFLGRRKTGKHVACRQFLCHPGRLGECQDPGGLPGRVGERAGGMGTGQRCRSLRDTGYRWQPPRSPRSRLNARHWSNPAERFDRLPPCTGLRAACVRRRSSIHEGRGIKLRIPNPHAQDISRGLLVRILRQACIEREEWEPF